MALAFGLLFTALYVAGFLLSMRRDGVPLTVSNILRYDGATVSRLIADLKTDGLRAVRHASTAALLGAYGLIAAFTVLVLSSWLFGHSAVR